MSPAMQALAYRIWAYAEARGWNVDEVELSEALGEKRYRIRAALRL